MAAPVGERVSLRARELATRGVEAARPLPAVAELEALDPAARHGVLEGLRVELYALAALLADATVRRAFEARSSHPPYGLVRSLKSDVRLMGEAGQVVGEGSIGSFYDLGKAYVETVVFHLHRQVGDQRASEDGWLLDRVEAVLALFLVDAGPATRTRLQDVVNFIYGGLHFGAGVTVQLIEVMNRMLDARGVGLAEKVQVISRSSRPAYQLATLNFDHVLAAYQRLQGPQTPAKTPDGQLSLVSWMDERRFTVHEAGGQPARIDLRDDAVGGPDGQGRRLEERPTTYATHGCPARIPPTGGPSAIATLWTWGVLLARDTGLLGPA
ncbi:MAG TPA: hypothetical protein VFO65_11075 [Acidimicrobiales bacterium]|nr:hypothetical protein [Acidimicrobiales bacterium]